MKMDELTQKSDRELQEILVSLQDELRKLRFSASERQLKNMTVINVKRRTIARIQTELGARIAKQQA